MAWQDEYRPASFRGVPFYVRSTGGETGRRLVTHEFPLRDTPYTEDLGEAALRFRITGYVIGDTYTTQRDQLLAALAGTKGAAQLILPWQRPLTARAGRVRWQEIEHALGACQIDMEFVRDGPQPSPVSSASTASGLLAGLNSLVPIIAKAYAIASLVASNPRVLLGIAENLLGGAAASFLGLSPTTVATLAALASGFTADPTDTVGTADAVLEAFQAASDNVVTAAQVDTPADDPVAGTVPVQFMAADPSGGLAALASWGGDLAVPANPMQAQQQQAIVDLVAGAATMATALAYAQIDWPTADAATTARDQLVDLMDTRVLAASRAGNADLARGWRAVRALAIADLMQRAQALPSLQPYVLAESLPSRALAQRLMQDPTQAPALVALNRAIHPLFMPRSGVYLAPASSGVAA
jgi:prophage DNA circulation protein